MGKAVSVCVLIMPLACRDLLSPLRMSDTVWGGGPGSLGMECSMVCGVGSPHPRLPPCPRHVPSGLLNFLGVDRPSLPEGGSLCLRAGPAPRCDAMALLPALWVAGRSLCLTCEEEWSEIAGGEPEGSQVLQPLIYRGGDSEALPLNSWN